MDIVNKDISSPSSGQKEADTGHSTMNQAEGNMDALQQGSVASFVLMDTSPPFTHIVSSLFLYHMLSSEDDYSDKVHIFV